MNSTQHLHASGQSPWLDNISRDMLDNGTLRRHVIEEAIIAGVPVNVTLLGAA